MRFQAAINGLKQALNTLSMSFTSEDFIDQPMASHWALNSKIGLEQIEKCFKFPYSHQKFILQSWYWKSLKNTWPIEAKICNKVLEIQANKKVEFLRQNDELTRIKNSKAFYFVAAKNQRRSILGQLSTMIPSYIDLNW